MKTIRDLLPGLVGKKFYINESGTEISKYVKSHYSVDIYHTLKSIDGDVLETEKHITIEYDSRDPEKTVKTFCYDINKINSIEKF